MDTNRIIEALETLSTAELRRVKAKVDELANLYDQWQQAEPVDATSGKTYRQEYTKCNKPACKACSNGQGHGPYWYTYWRDGTKLRKQYIGKEYHKI